jgi:hypothetical protein
MQFCVTASAVARASAGERGQRASAASERARWRGRAQPARPAGEHGRTPERSLPVAQPGWRHGDGAGARPARTGSAACGGAVSAYGGAVSAARLEPEGRAEEGVAGLTGCCEASRSPNGLGGLEVFGHEKITAGPQQPRSLVLRGERTGYVNNPPRLQLKVP